MTRPPAHLSKPAKALYASITSAYVLESHHLAVLVKGLEASDRADAARAVIERDGLLVETRFGEVKASAAVAIERDSRTAFFAAIKQLGLDIDGPPSPSTRNRRS